METFGEWLRQQRNQLQLTREQFAERVGCSVALLRKIEDGERRPSAQIAELIANSLDIPAADRATFIRVARGELNLERLPTGLKPAPAPIAPPAPRPRVNLPILPTPLIGRQREVEELTQLLHDPHCRLLTLVGSGGIGKTRLAIETASRLQAAFADGVYFVPLAPVNSTRFITPVVADSIGFTFQSTSQIDPQLQLFNYLREKLLLLVIDNLEHLLIEPGIEGLAELLANAPRVKLLVTSRESLGLQDEWVFEVQGLPIPDSQYAEGSAQHTSAELFLQRARRAHVSFHATQEDYPAIVRICQLVNGMPLGIELAAAWTRTLTCGEIAQEIERGLDFLSVSTRDLPARHRSMRAIFEHSWKLLMEEEQTVLLRLSVFRGGFKREAAEQVAEATLPILSTLVTKSLVHRSGEGRYDLHELVRQFAADRLHENPAEEATVQNSHGRYYLAALQQREAALTSERQETALAELGADIDNLRLAWEWAAAQHKVAQLRQAVWPWWYYFSLRGLFREGEVMLLRAVESVRTMEFSDAADTAARELALAHLQVFPTMFTLRLGRVAEAQQELQQILEILRKHHAQEPLVDALLAQGTALMFMGQFRESSRYLRESYALGCALNRPWETATCASWIGKAEFELGNYAEAQHWFTEGLTLSEALGSPVNMSFAISALSQALYALGRAAEMEPILRKRLQLAEEAGYQITTGLLKEQLAQADYALGNLKEARLLCQEIIAVYRELGDFWNLSRALNQMGRLELASGDKAQAETRFAEALDVAYKGHLSANAVDALDGIATVWARSERKASALEIVLHILQHPVTVREVGRHAEQLRAELEAQLTQQQIEAAQARAQRKTLEVTVSEILSRSESAE